MTTATFTLHRYQTEATQAVYDSWAADLGSRPAVILPTGTGKTVVFSSLVASLVSDGVQRAIVLVHRDELVQQTVAKLSGFGLANIGIIKAEQNDVTAPVIVASVQTLFRPARRDALMAELSGSLFTVVVDELHHYTAKAYRKVLETLGVFDDSQGSVTPAVGFTATFVRTDSRHLANDWTPVYEKTIAWAIEHGYLCPVDAIGVRVPDLELDKASRSGGDFTDLGLGRQLQESSAAEIIPQAWKRHANGRPTILFAPTIASCEDLVAGLVTEGITTEAVYGGTPIEERRAIYARVRAGQTKVLASVGVLTEGFDMPEISCAILARPTESRGLYQQMVGRVLRTFPGKDDAILLDVIGNTEAHDLCNITDLRRTHDQAEESKDPQPCQCGIGMGGLCLCQTRGGCTRNKNMDLCLCSGCDCPTSGERGRIDLIAGADDIHVDVFKGSGSAWLTTYGGTWFLSTRDFLVAILPVAGTDLWRPARTHNAKVAAGPNMRWLGAPSDLETAMEVAQNYAVMADPHITNRSAKWRQRKAKDGQLNWARSIVARRGLEPLPEGVRSGPCSDIISRDEASKTLGR